MKLRAMALAAAGVVGTISVAHAQQPAAPAPAAEAPAAPPAATPAEPPAGAPAALPPGSPVAPSGPKAQQPTPDQPPAPPPPSGSMPDSPTASPSIAPTTPPGTNQAQPSNQTAATFGPDTTTDEPDPTINRFRFSWFTWHQEASTKTFGVGRDYIGTEDEVYNWQFKITPRYYFYDTPTDQAFVGATLTLDTELTNSDTTTTKREPLFGDLPISVGYSRVWTSADKETTIGFGPSGNIILPTSKASLNTGKYFTTTLALGARGIIKLAGKKSDWFPSVLAAASVSYQHLFSRATTPTVSSPDKAEGLGIFYRQTATGAAGHDDTLSGLPFATNGMKLSLVYFLSIYRDLSFGNIWEVAIPFKQDFQTGGGNGAVCDVVTPTGCVQAQRDPTRTHGIPLTTFDVSLSYNVLDVARVDLGYNNSSLQLAPDGTRRSLFYSPDSVFYLDMVAYLDSIAGKAAKAAKKKNKAAAKNQLAQLPRFGQIFSR